MKPAKSLTLNKLDEMFSSLYVRDKLPQLKKDIRLGCVELLSSEKNLEPYMYEYISHGKSRAQKKLIWEFWFNSKNCQTWYSCSVSRFKPMMVKPKSLSLKRWKFVPASQTVFIAQVKFNAGKTNEFIEFNKIYLMVLLARR